ncbi:MAG: S24/S26 family peptidase [Clostridia bacterium]|nr:S24/S26 family peptidase [Clostridia bacterium]
MIIKHFKPSMHEIAPYIKEVISVGKEVRLTVTGFSMYPLLRGGSDDVILAKPSEIKKYDVVLFERENGEYIFHRVIKLKGDILTIAGDNETKKEYPVSKDKVIASMKSFVRSGKTYSVNALWYKLYSRMWLFIFPARHIAARMLHNLAQLCRKLKGGHRHKKSK